METNYFNGNLLSKYKKHDGIKIQSTSYVSGKLYCNLYKDLAGVPMAFGQHEIYYDLFDRHYDFAQHIPGNTFKYLYDFTTNTKIPVFTIEKVRLECSRHCQ